CRGVPSADRARPRAGALPTCLCRARRGDVALDGVLPLRVAIYATPIGFGRGGDETYLRNLLAGLALVARERDRFVVFKAAGANLPRDVEASARFAIRPVVRGPSLAWYGLRLPIA